MTHRGPFQPLPCSDSVISEDAASPYNLFPQDTRQLLIFQQTLTELLGRSPQAGTGRSVRTLSKRRLHTL